MDRPYDTKHRRRRENVAPPPPPDLPEHADDVVTADHDSRPPVSRRPRLEPPRRTAAELADVDRLVLSAGSCACCARARRDRRPLRPGSLAAPGWYGFGAVTRSSTARGRLAIRLIPPARNQTIDEPQARDSLEIRRGCFPRASEAVADHPAEPAPPHRLLPACSSPFFCSVRFDQTGAWWNSCSSVRTSCPPSTSSSGAQGLSSSRAGRESARRRSSTSRPGERSGAAFRFSAPAARSSSRPSPSAGCVSCSSGGSRTKRMTARGSARRARGGRPAVAPRARPRGRAADTSFAVLHGLYWLATNLAATRPLLLAVDAAHARRLGLRRAEMKRRSLGLEIADA
jgi:hypothetical protein